MLEQSFVIKHVADVLFAMHDFRVSSFAVESQVPYGP